jgi:chemotaxis methyl-accepting protein methylase
MPSEREEKSGGEAGGGIFQPPVLPPLEPPLLDAWEKLVEERAGLVFGESRRRQLQRALWETMRERGIAGYAELYRFVTETAGGPREWDRIVERLVNHETYFFRHQPSFDALRREILPPVIEERRRLKRLYLNAWSACCATGEEAYSLAMVMRELTDSHLWQLSVIGTDISRSVLERAREGRYRQFSLRSMPPEAAKRFLTEEISENGTPHFRVTEDLRAVTRFEWFNLLEDGTFPLTPQDMIFCQNVLIYFAPERRPEIAASLGRRLAIGGHLLFAPGEIVGLRVPWLVPERFENVLAYRRSQ